MEFAFDEVVEFVHIDIHQKLAGEIAERKTDVRAPFGVKTVDDSTEEIDRRIFRDTIFKDVFKYRMVDVRKELSYVAFQYPGGSSMIA